MQFDFQRLSQIVTPAYLEECEYSLEQCLEVFRCYFHAYEDRMGRPHPPIRREQITRIMQEMPCIDMEDRGGSLELLDPEDYPLLIGQHFKTYYQHCDYNTNHFFSGRIRELLLYEVE